MNMGMRTRRLVLRILIGIPLILFAASIIYPTIWMVLNGFKTDNEIFLTPLAMPTNFSFNNYIRAGCKKAC